MDLESALKESQAREVALLARLEASKEALAQSEAEKEALRCEKEALARKHEALGHFLPFRMPFAGESDPWSPDSVLSHCSGALLPMFDTAEATVLRLLCREFKEAVAQFPWEDDETVIRGSVAAWRACYPKARWANVRKDHGGRESPVVDADFVHFVGLRRLNMKWCNSVTDAAFLHLKGIHTLGMAGCDQPSITDAAFVNLKGIHTLGMAGCDQPSITDAAFANLKGIHELSMNCCNQLTITDSAFLHLKGIYDLSMAYCNQPTITDSAFAHLKGIDTLCIVSCSQLTSAVFSYLKGAKQLYISGCPQLIPTDAVTGFPTLYMEGHTDAAKAHAGSLGYDAY